ncbi:MAG: queuine tRNA-ribosyltransferase family protein [Oscillospiraceae bacterium]|nr:queuine tRNA-ribosyltransferase family protein [Oscillospiraceae bacterium]
MKGSIRLPAFMPDATYGYVRSAGWADVRKAGVECVVMNAYHLATKAGTGPIGAMGGVGAYTGWGGPVLTDSGGFQVLSLIGKDARHGTVRDEGITFRPGNGEKVLLTPEKSVRSQLAFGSDVIMCLDHCDGPGDARDAVARSVERTLGWARRCKDEYARAVGAMGAEGPRPLLFAIVQGGADMGLRERCAAGLASMGFDGYGFGGWPLDGKGRFLDGTLAYAASLMPDGALKYAMGVGRPDEVVRCHAMGYDLFDCVIPTREARRKRLYVFTDGWESALRSYMEGAKERLRRMREEGAWGLGAAGDADGSDGGARPRGGRGGDGGAWPMGPHEGEGRPFYSIHHAEDDKYARDASPVSGLCDCELCLGYGKAFLRHMFRMGEPSAMRLATIHNLRFYATLMGQLQRMPDDG